MATDWSRLKVTNLRAELKRRALPQNGVKSELIARLAEDDNKASNEDEAVDDVGENEVVGDTTINEQAAIPEHPTTATAAIPEPTAQPLPDTQGAPNEPPPPVEEPTSETSDVPSSTTAQENRKLPVVDEPQTAEDELKTATDDPTPSSFPIASLSEVRQDIQKRKRRSASPRPTTESLKKRTKHEVLPDKRRESPTGPEMADLPSIHGPIEKEDEAEPSEELNRDAAEKELVQPLGDLDLTLSTDIHPPKFHADTGVDEDRALSGDIHAEEPIRKAAADNGPDRATWPEKERTVPPSIHPATTALYIKNFMRPLREPMVEDHLAELATPPGRDVDPGVVTFFFLDPIRTHAFVEFASTAAASRVRTALHDQIWPDERNRKALWVDFIPPAEITGWVERERSGGGGRSSSNRWEVFYDRDGDHVSVSLENEITTEPSSARASAPSSGPPRSAPSSYPGIEAAPLGPRADLGGRTALSRTRSHPLILFQPVAEELARRRLDNIQELFSPDPNRGFGREINRYSFESGDKFVDRGPEVFEGIRPPHREAERRGRGGRGGRRGGPPPRPRGDRYFSRGESGRDSGPPPRSRYEDDRWSRDERWPRRDGLREDNFRDGYRGRR